MYLLHYIPTMIGCYPKYSITYTCFTYLFYLFGAITLKNPPFVSHTQVVFHYIPICFIYLFYLFGAIIFILIELDDGKIYRKALYLMVKAMVSCRFSLKPIQWYTHHFATPRWWWTAWPMNFTSRVTRRHKRHGDFTRIAASENICTWDDGIGCWLGKSMGDLQDPTDGGT